jgi:signal peptidase I
MDGTILNKIIYGGGVIFDLLKWVILAGIIVILIGVFWLSVFVTDGISMEPTFKNGDVVLLRKNYYVKNEPKRGDVVVVRYPGDPDNKKYVKRVIGLPGEDLRVLDGKVFIDGRPISESYIRYDVKTEPNGEWQLGVNDYFLMGDNRTFSNDSRYFGPVEKRFFYGKAIAVIFPHYNTYFN